MLQMWLLHDCPASRLLLLWIWVRQQRLLRSIETVISAVLIGQNSITSIQSGIVNGHIYMIDGFIRQLRETLCKDNELLSLVATGGHAETVIPYCRNKMKIDADLTVHGAAALYFANRKSN